MMLAINLYKSPVMESLNDFNSGIWNVDCKGYSDCDHSNSGIQVDEKVAYADVEPQEVDLQDIDMQSVYQNALYFLAYTYNLPVTDMVTGDVLPYNVYDDTSGVFHNWTISDAQGQRQSFFNFIKGLTGGVIDWDVMAAAYSAVQLDFEVGTYRLLYDVFYTEDHNLRTLPENISSATEDTNAILGYVKNHINPNIGSLVHDFQSVLLPRINTIITSLSSIDTDLGNIYDKLNDVNTNIGLVASRLGQILTNSVDIEELIDDQNDLIGLTNEYTSGTRSQLQAHSQYLKKLTPINNALDTVNTNVTSIATYISAMANNINAIKTNSENTASRLSSVITNTNNTNSKLDTINSTLQNLSVAGGGLTSAESQNLAQIANNVETVKTSVDNIKSNFTSHVAKVSAIYDLISQIYSKIQSVDTKLTDANTNLNSGIGVLQDIYDEIDGMQITGGGLTSDEHNALLAMRTSLALVQTYTLNILQRVNSYFQSFENYLDEILYALQNQSYEITVPPGSIAGVGDYTQQLSNINNKLQNIFNMLSGLNENGDEEYTFVYDGVDDTIANITSHMQATIPFKVTAWLTTAFTLLADTKAVAPSADISLPSGLHQTTTLHLNMSAWGEDVRNVSNFICVLLYVLALAMATRKFVMWE